MEFNHKEKVSVFDVASGSVMFLKSIVQKLHTAADSHFRTETIHADEMLGKNAAWMLKKIGLEIIRYPELDENIIISTCHTGIDRFRAYRDYMIKTENEMVIKASSLWLLIDLKTKRIKRIPEEYSGSLVYNSKREMSVDIESWKSPDTFNPDFSMNMSLRSSDFDLLGHMNNAIYLDFIETALFEMYGQNRSVKKLLINYGKEILRDQKSVDICILKKSERSHLFAIEKTDREVCASGEVVLY